MIIFKKIRWRNFLSTGNVFSEIDLTAAKTNLIVGSNGAGKSTILDALTFALFGKPFRKINMELHGVPLALPLLLLTILLQVGGGLAIIFDRQTRTAAFLLAGLTLLINLFMHDFWNEYPGGNAQHELQNFIKNLGIFAGLLLLASRRPGERRDANAP